MKRTLFSAGLLVLVMILVSACGLHNISGQTFVSGTGTPSGSDSIHVVNNTGTRICFLMVSPITDTSFGSDLFGNTGVLENGGDVTVQVQSAGSYDMMAVLQASDGKCSDQGQRVTNMNVNVSGSITWTVTPPS